MNAPVLTRPDRPMAQGERTVDRPVPPGGSNLRNADADRRAATDLSLGQIHPCDHRLLREPLPPVPVKPLVVA